MNKHGASFGERVVVVGLAAQIAVTAGLIIDRLPAPALVNESPSLPRGLYLRDWGASPARGAVVAFAQPEEARPYLGLWGMPPEVMLIKRVAAVEGDEVCAGDTVLRTPERTVRIRGRDRAGLALPRWTDCRRLDPGELFLLGDTETSFDSRYFGPVRTERLAGVYKEALRW